MDVKYAYLACIIFLATGTTLFGLDFLNDPFFKQLASELDSMFAEKEAASGDSDPAEINPFESSAPKSPASTLSKKTASQDSSQPKVIHDAKKDLKTLFTENLTLSAAGEKKPASPFSRSASPRQKAIISSQKKKAYFHFMDDFVKKVRLIERFYEGNPGNVFDEYFLAAFSKIIDYIDQIEATHHLIKSKQIYLRTFFSEKLQKTREKIILIIPRLDAALVKLRPFLEQEESLDDDIDKMQQAAHGKSLHKKSAKKAKKPVRHKTQSKKATTPSLKKSTPLPPPMLPADFILEKIKRNAQ